MTIQQSIQNFLDSKVRNIVKPGTLGYYKSNYRIIEKFCELKGFTKLSDIPEDIHLLFIDYLKNIRKVSNGTINKRIEKLKQLLRFYKIEFDWFTDSRLSTVNKRFDIIPEHDLIKILKYVNSFDSSSVNLSYKILIFLLLDTGSRIDELLHIEIKNISFIDNSILLTHTKTDDHRYVFFSCNTAVLLKEYINLLSTRKYLMYNFRTNDRMFRGCVVRFLNKLKLELNINVLHPHMFRHTFATLLIENQAPIFLVSKLLGHSDVKITMRYIHENKRILKKDFDKYFPSLIN